MTSSDPRTSHLAPRTSHLSVLDRAILRTNPHHEFTSLSSGAVPAFCRQRLRRADLRDRLVPTAPAGDRIVLHLARHPARHVHGRDVPGQPAVVANDFRAASPAARL